MRLIARELAHEYTPGHMLFSDVSFDLEAGELVSVTGPSGSGKSTLLSILAGALRPTGGTVERWGDGRTAWIFQNPYGVAARSAIDHVVLPLLASGARRLDAVVLARNLLQDFGLTHVEAQRFASLSGGEAQRLMLARAVATAPGLVLVDEPTAQLDPASAQGVIETLSALATHGAIVLIASHDARIEAVCPRTIRVGCSPNREDA